MADALTPPFAVAALVLCVAAVAKLRAPATAARGLRAAGSQVPVWLVRAFAVVEIALGVWCIAAPGPIAAAALACAYAGFSGLSLLLARRRASCGCFGERDAPASVAQSVLSAALALIAIAATVRPPHGVAWLLERPAATASLLAIAVAAAAYATVLAYVELPVAWRAWTGRAWSGR